MRTVLLSKNRNIKRQIFIMSSAIVILIVSIVFGIFFGTVASRRENARRELSMAASQISNDMKLFCADIERVVDNLYNSPKMQEFFTEDDPQKRFIINQYVQDIINSTIYGNSSINSIRILQENYMLSTAGLTNQHGIFFKVNNDYGVFDLKPEKAFYSHVYWDEATEQPYIAYVRPVNAVRKNTGHSVGPTEKKLFYVLCSLDRMQQYVNSVKITVPGLVIAVSENERVALSNNKALIGEKAPAFEDTAPQAYEAVSTSFEAMNLKIDMYVPVQSIYSESLVGLKETFIISALSIAIICALGMWIAKNLTAPVSKLVSDINNIEGSSGIKETRLGSYRLEEIDAIASYINDMLSRIQTANSSLMEANSRLHQSVIAKKEAEIAFYQTQINPHFLYNTLECLRSLGQAYDVEEVQIISLAMAKIFRYSVKARDVVALAEEIECAKDYFEIIKIRFLNKYAISFKINDELLTKKVPKMILQPLVENAIGHGLNGRKSGGMIEISAAQEKNTLVLSVFDNGNGISKQKLDELTRHLSLIAQGEQKDVKHGVALDNINRRIKLDFGDEYGLFIHSEEGTGTTVTIRLPLENN